MCVCYEQIVLFSIKVQLFNEKCIFLLKFMRRAEVPTLIRLIRTNCLAGSPYSQQVYSPKNEGVGLSIQDSLTSRIPHQPLAGRLAKTQLSAKILHSIFCFSRTCGYLIGFEPMLQVPQTCVLTTNTINTMFKNLCRQVDLNHRLKPYESSTLPLSYSGSWESGT